MGLENRRPRDLDQESRLWSFDSDATVQSIALKYLGHDARVTFRNQDAGAWLGDAEAAQFDLIFADAWPGKYSHLDDALRALKTGGLYVIDDMLPQPAWPEGHAANAASLLSLLEKRTDLPLTRLCWSTGLVIAAKTGRGRKAGPPSLPRSLFRGSWPGSSKDPERFHRPVRRAADALGGLL